jgi:hypothetical protein
MKIKVSDVVFRPDLYPRLEHNQSKAQEYSVNIENLPPIELNQHNELIDGFHRWTAHKLAEVDEIEAVVTETNSDNHFLELAIERNNSHGLQMSQTDKKKVAVRLYGAADFEERGALKERLPKLLSVSTATLYSWLADIDSAQIAERNAAILSLYLRCYTQEEIGKAVGLGRRAVGLLLEEFPDLEKVPKLSEKEADKYPIKVGDVENSKFGGDDFQAPIYNVWAFGKKTNATEHFGNTEQRIVDNLLWLYTKPFDIVVDPFGGGGSTLDVCEKRLRRCWISDRKPKPGMEGTLRTMDICKELPSVRWKEVSLTYLDPPYWRQAQGEYSDDMDDLANMTLEDFTAAMCGVIKRIAAKQESGFIAMIIQPTQWRAEPKGSFADHVFDIVQGVSKVAKLEVENRISCPYSSEQCQPQMVDWAKENKKVLVLSRELVIWKIK